jgi:hypothetical protein
MEHLYGRDGIAYEDYEYPLPKRKLKRETPFAFAPAFKIFFISPFFSPIM